MCRREDWRGKGKLSGESFPFPLQTSPFLFKDFRLVGRPRGRSSFQSGVEKIKAPFFTCSKYIPFNNKEPEHIVQALLFAHRESGEKGFDKVESLWRGRGRFGGGRGNFLQKVSPSPSNFIHSITNAFAACVAAGMFPSAKRRTTSKAAGSCLRKASCASEVSRPRTQVTVSSLPCGERPMPRRRR